MPINLGNLDRLIRLIIGAVLIIAGLTVFQSGAAIAVVVGIVLVVTAAIKFCPLYRLFGLRTCKK